MKNIRGFTLIEIVLVITLTSIVSGFIGLFLSQGLASYLATKPQIGTANKTSIAMENLLRELKSAQAVSALTSNSLSFVNHDGETVVIDLSGATIRRNVNAQGAQPLLTGVSAFSLSFFNEALAATAIAADVRFITVSITVNEGNGTYSLISGTLFRKLL